MSQPKTKRTSWIGWVISAVLIVGSVGLWTQRQYVVDAIQYHQFTPSPAVEQVAADAGLTDDATFTFYATRPAVQSRDAFNKSCKRQEPDSPILGCYSANRIYIYDVTDSRLDGIKEVTAAHELLHAEYERLPDSEKKRINTLLQKVYESGTNDDLEARMKYYAKTEPGQSLNELHSIIGTEFGSIGVELENHYSRYFNDRSKLVSLHNKVNSRFDSLQEESDDLVNRAEKLAFQIKSDTELYNSQISTLNNSVTVFNGYAQSGQFTTQADFMSARQQLVSESENVAAFRQKILANIAEYKTLVARVDSINAESASLNQSLDSVLSDAPKI